MKIGIIGNGVVGNATAKAFERGHEVLVYDCLPERRTHCLGNTIMCDLIFVCLPTPAARDGSCNTDAVDAFFAGLGVLPFVDERKQNFVLRSTVPIGYTRKARKRFNLPNLVHSPEFLTARTAVEDTANPTRLVVGWYTTSGALPIVYSHPVLDLYKQRWPNVPPLNMTSDESEAVKLFQNAFSAVKIAAFNEFRSLSDKLGMDWNAVLGALLASGWINPMHTQVPGPDGKRGFGGGCLPKDLNNLMWQMLEERLSPMVCSSAAMRNRLDRPKE